MLSVLSWMAMVGIALGAVNASSEVAIRQFFLSPGSPLASDLDVMGLISMETLFRMSQLGDISRPLLVVSVAVMVSQTWRERAGLFLWISALAALTRIGVIRLFLHWPSTVGDMDLIWTIPSPVTIPVGLTIGAAVFCLLLCAAIFTWAGRYLQK